jgi:DAK2 domain fusion protein YloV
LAKLTLTDFDKLLRGALYNLNRKKDFVNKLNVFPVPDGDTGTNMYLTLKTAVEEVDKKRPQNLKDFGKAVCDGALIGGRGNSGVILSQILKGFFESLDALETVDTIKFSNALITASKVAYQAVIKPVEGTILTVMKAVAIKAAFTAAKEQDFIKFFERMLEESKISLAKTIDLLPVLKEAGVVDAGGQGLVCLIEGGLMALKGEKLPEEVQKTFEEEIEQMGKSYNIGGKLEFRYDTVILLSGVNIDSDKINEDLTKLGDSIVVAKTQELTKVHIHSNDPHKVLEYLVKIGNIKEAKIEDMQAEADEFLKQKQVNNTFVESKLPFSIISIAQGEGFKKIFLNLGVETVIDGGQTMNPSINDILTAINSCKKDYVVVMPNNKNIILAAQEAKKLVKSKTIEIIPTMNVVQAIPVILSFNTEEPFEENISNALKTLEKSHSISITYSIRKTQINGLKIKKGDIVGMFDEDIISKGKKPVEALTGIIELKNEIFQAAEFIGVYFGKDTKPEDTEEIVRTIKKYFPDLEIDITDGGQPYYYYLISIE